MQEGFPIVLSFSNWKLNPIERRSNLDLKMNQIHEDNVKIYDKFQNGVIDLNLPALLEDFLLVGTLQFHM